jgi:hypothetical protein
MREEIKTALIKKFYEHVWRLRAEYFGEDPPFDRLDVKEAAWPWFEQLLRLNVLPTEVAPSGSYPDELYHMYVVLMTIAGKTVEEHASSDEGEDDSKAEEAAGAGAGLSTPSKRSAGAGSDADDGGARKKPRSAPSFVTPPRPNSVNVNEMTKQWKWSKKEGTKVRNLFYKELASSCAQGGAQFNWTLVEQALSFAIQWYNSNATTVSPCPSDAHFVAATAAGTARSTWLATKSMKQRSSTKPHGDEPDDPATKWVMYYKHVIHEAMNKANKTTARGRASVRSIQQRSRDQLTGSSAGSSGSSSSPFADAAARRAEAQGRQLRELASTLSAGMQKSSAKVARALVIRGANNPEEARAL